MFDDEEILARRPDLGATENFMCAGCDLWVIGKEVSRLHLPLSFASLR